MTKAAWPVLLSAALALLFAGAPIPTKENRAQNAGVKPAEIFFQVQLVLGSESEKEETDKALRNDPVIKELQSLLKLKSFALLDDDGFRVKEGETSHLPLGKNDEYLLIIKPRLIKSDKEETIEAEVRFGYSFAGQPRMNLISSILTMKPGEKTVVGVSKTPTLAYPPNPDRGLILIIAGKILK
jgi:hypothetical protein